MTVTNVRRENRFVGPHEGRELAMMVEGTKPLSMFVDVAESDVAIFDEETFDTYASEGKLIKRAWTEKGRHVDLDIVLYALPEEAWRINAMMLVQSVYACGPSGWRPDLERIIGRLLGYSAEDIEKFIDWTSEHHSAASGAATPAHTADADRLPEKPTTWDGFFETLKGLEVPPDFLSPEERRQDQSRPDPFEDWTE